MMNNAQLLKSFWLSLWEIRKTAGFKVAYYGLREYKKSLYEAVKNG